MLQSSHGDNKSAQPLHPELPATVVDRVVEQALEEDLGWGDVTTETLVPPDVRAEGRLVARASGVVAGLAVARAVFERVDPNTRMEPVVRDGERVEPGTVLARVRGTARSILKAERVALNFLQRMSGTATLTARFVDAVEGTGARIVDTRKTTPGLRALEKYAVRCGGGHNHRFNLSDAVLFKDNHRASLEAAGIGVAEALARVRGALPHTVTVEVEVDSLAELDDVLAAGPDTVLLDNMSPDELAEAVRRVGGRARVEASGGVTLDTVREIAEAGVDQISVGALTHSAPALDIALDFVV